MNPKTRGPVETVMTWARMGYMRVAEGYPNILLDSWLLFHTETHPDKIWSHHLSIATNATKAQEPSP